jgi:hypothetical protein
VLLSFSIDSEINSTSGDEAISRLSLVSEGEVLTSSDIADLPCHFESLGILISKVFTSYAGYEAYPLASPVWLTDGMSLSLMVDMGCAMWLVCLFLIMGSFYRQLKCSND